GGGAGGGGTGREPRGGGRGAREGRDGAPGGGTLFGGWEPPLEGKPLVSEPPLEEKPLVWDAPPRAWASTPHPDSGAVLPDSPGREPRTAAAKQSPGSARPPHGLPE